MAQDCSLWDLQPWSQYSGTRWYFNKLFPHHKWNDAWLYKNGLYELANEFPNNLKFFQENLKTACND